jgi:hypothetical protein
VACRAFRAPRCRLANVSRRIAEAEPIYDAGIVPRNTGDNREETGHSTHRSWDNLRQKPGGRSHRPGNLGASAGKELIFIIALVKVLSQMSGRFTRIADPARGD